MSTPGEETPSYNPDFELAETLGLPKAPAMTFERVTGIALDPEVNQRIISRFGQDREAAAGFVRDALVQDLGLPESADIPAPRVQAERLYRLDREGVLFRALLQADQERPEGLAAIFRGAVERALDTETPSLV